MTKMVELSLVDTILEVRHNINSFNAKAIMHIKRVSHTIRTTSYWVKDNKSGMFGPSKFLAYKSMNFNDYKTATKLYFTGAMFNGNTARLHIEKVFGQEYVEDLELTNELVRWGKNLLGSNVFDGIKREKWKFNAIS